MKYDQNTGRPNEPETQTCNTESKWLISNVVCDSLERKKQQQPDGANWVEPSKSPLKQSKRGTTWLVEGNMKRKLEDDGRLSGENADESRRCVIDGTGVVVIGRAVTRHLWILSPATATGFLSRLMACSSSSFLLDWLIDSLFFVVVVVLLFFWRPADFLFGSVSSFLVRSLSIGQSKLDRWTNRFIFLCFSSQNLASDSAADRLLESFLDWLFLFPLNGIGGFFMSQKSVKTPSSFQYLSDILAACSKNLTPHRISY